MRLSILNQNRVIYRYNYCSEYGLGRARMVTDTRGRHYVLLEHAEGRGTRATTTYLTIYRFTDDLDERVRIPLEVPVGVQANSSYTYRLETPAGGGLILRGPWHLTGDLVPGEQASPSGRTALEIDTAPARRN